MKSKDMKELFTKHFELVISSAFSFLESVLCQEGHLDHHPSSKGLLWFWTFRSRTVGDLLQSFWIIGVKIFEGWETTGRIRIWLMLRSNMQVQGMRIHVHHKGLATGKTHKGIPVSLGLGGCSFALLLGLSHFLLVPLSGACAFCTFDPLPMIVC